MSQETNQDLSATFVYEFIVREAHLDTFGHVNNAEYLRLFEEARWELITSRGYGLDRVKESGVGPVLLDVHLRFKREIKLRQKIKIETTAQMQSDKIYKIFQKMVDAETGSLHAEAEYTAGVFDTQKRKLIQAPDEWKAAIGLL